MERKKIFFSFFKLITAFVFSVGLFYFLFIDFLDAKTVKLPNKKIVDISNFNATIYVTNVPGIKHLAVEKKITNFYDDYISNKTLNLFIMTNTRSYSIVDITSDPLGVHEAVVETGNSYVIVTNYFEAYDFPDIYSYTNILSGKISLTLDISYMDTQQVIGVHSVGLKVSNLLGGVKDVFTNQIYVVDRMPPFLSDVMYTVKHIKTYVGSAGGSLVYSNRTESTFNLTVDDIGTGAFDASGSQFLMRVLRSRYTGSGGHTSYETYYTNILQSFSSYFSVGEDVVNIWVILRDHCGNISTNQIR